MLYNNCKYKDLDKLEVEDINFYITTGLLINPNSWNIPDLIEWKYGKVMELCMMFETEISLKDVVLVVSFATGMSHDTVGNKLWHDVFSFYNWLNKEIQKINSYLATLGIAPTVEEEAAGIERFNEFGVFATIDRLAGGDPLKYDAIEAMPFHIIFTKLKLNKVEYEYQEAYREIIRFKNKE
jgi:hypothetical protein